MSTLYTPPGSPYPKRKPSSKRKVVSEEPLGLLYKPAEHKNGAVPFRVIDGKESPLYKPPKKKLSLRLLPQQRMGVKQELQQLLFLPDPDDPKSRGAVVALGSDPEKGICLTAPISQALMKEVLPIPFSQIQLCLKVRFACAYFKPI